MTSADRVLTWLLRADAAVLLAAVIPVFFPTELMAEMHQRLGLGELPRGRLTEYLTRSVAASYVLHGFVVLLLSTDVRRYRPLVAPLAAAHLAFALVLLGIDLYAGMPGWWTAVEVGTIAGVAIAMLFVNRWAKTAESTANGPGSCTV
jgi:hypothetical protein